MSGETTVHLNDNNGAKQIERKKERREREQADSQKLINVMGRRKNGAGRMRRRINRIRSNGGNRGRHCMIGAKTLNEVEAQLDHKKTT